MQPSRFFALCVLFLALTLHPSIRAQAPVILSFQPMIAASGETVTIVGQNFANVTNVFFANANARSFTVNNSGDTVRAVVSAAASSGLITIVQPSGRATSATMFVFAACPLPGTVLTRVSPITIVAGSRDVEVSFEGYFITAGGFRFVAISQGKDTVLPPFRGTSRFVSVTIPTVFLQQPGPLRLTLVGICQAPLSTTITIQAQAPTSVAGHLPVPERVFPNPVRDELTVEKLLDTPSKLTLSLFNTLGQRLIRVEYDAPKGLFSTALPCQNLALGAYMLEIWCAERRTLHHVVKY